MHQVMQGTPKSATTKLVKRFDSIMPGKTIAFMRSRMPKISYHYIAVKTDGARRAIPNFLIEKIKRYEEESGNTVWSDDSIVDSMGKYLMEFTVEMADGYHEIILDTR